MCIDVRNYTSFFVSAFDVAQPQVLELPIPSTREVLVSYSGTALGTLNGQPSGAWKRAQFALTIPTVNGRKWTFRSDRGPGWTLVQRNQPHCPIPNSVTTASLAAIFNSNTAVNAGWAVDAAWTEIVQGNPEFQQDDYLQLRALVAVSDSDGFIYRISYQVTLLGHNL